MLPAGPFCRPSISQSCWQSPCCQHQKPRMKHDTIMWYHWALYREGGGTTPPYPSSCAPLPSYTRHTDRETHGEPRPKPSKVAANTPVVRAARRHPPRPDQSRADKQSDTAGRSSLVRLGSDLLFPSPLFPSPFSFSRRCSRCLHFAGFTIKTLHSTAHQTTCDRLAADGWWWLNRSSSREGLWLVNWLEFVRGVDRT